MKTRSLLFGLMLLQANAVVAQDKYPACETKYFKGTDKIATTICFDKDNRLGKATAFDIHGKQIYQRDVRRVYGSAIVLFSYYDGGAVKVANFSSHPDGGIQWENTITYFAPDGAITREDDNGYDRLHAIQSPPAVRPAPQGPKKKQEVMACAVPYATEYWYINDAKIPLVVVACRKGYAKDMKATVVQPSDTVKGGEYIMAEQFVNISDYYDFVVKPAEDVSRKFRAHPDIHTVSVKKEVQRCYFHLAAAR